MSQPTDAELELLKLLWRDGPLSAREVQGRAEPELGWMVSTTRTLLERMRAKGLLERRAVHGLAVYAAATPKVEVIGGMLRRLEQMLDIDGALPASAFSGSRLLSGEDLDALDSILAEDRTGDPASSRKRSRPRGGKEGES